MTTTYQPVLGDRVARFVAAGSDEETSVVLGGLTDQMFRGEVHKGVYAVPSSQSREGVRTISGRVSMVSYQNCWVTVTVLWYRVSGGVLTEVQATTDVDYRYLSDGVPLTIDFYGYLPEDFDPTHWQPKFTFTTTLPTTEASGDGDPLPNWSVVDMLYVYIPDNGLPLNDQPYLDGDQPYGVWERTPYESPSIFGDNPNYPQPLVLAPALVIPDSVTEADDDSDDPTSE